MGKHCQSYDTNQYNGHWFIHIFQATHIVNYSALPQVVIIESRDYV